MRHPFGAGLPRRAAFGAAGALTALALARPAAGQQAAFRAEWSAFLQRYGTAERRIVDTGNGGVSDSEGQGWALLFAEHAGDRDAFDRILSWTERTLRGSRHESRVSVRFERTDREGLSVFPSANQPVRHRVAFMGLADTAVTLPRTDGHLV